ncbi:Hsp20/alpha crystallin family protein [Caproiciproducens sp. LBM24188]|nr:Hsp20/alpha crystallin family protein [Oscillospiraceae bacterium]HHV33042.1 Hsp20/alpha crystallin family protein [Clostridiales bacterium]
MFDLIPFEQRSRNMFDYFNRMSQEFFGDWDKDFYPCRTDVLDQGDKYVLKADLPGFNKEDIHINIEGNYLTLTAEHREENDNSNGNFIRRERRYGSFSRSFDITNIDADRISARYDRGVLELSLPKKETALPPSRQIEIQ